jgi:hypothetical protein
MPTKTPPSLPERLRYLQPFTHLLARLRREDLGDIDATRLDAALRSNETGTGLVDNLAASPFEFPVPV